MPTLNGEHVTPKRLMSCELRFSSGAVLPALQRGAVTPTPNGRLVSEGRVGRRTQRPPAPRAGAGRASPLRTVACGFLARPHVSNSDGHTRTDQARTLPRSSLTARLHGRTFTIPSPSAGETSRTGPPSARRDRE